MRNPLIRKAVLLLTTTALVNAQGWASNVPAIKAAFTATPEPSPAKTQTSSGTAVLTTTAPPQFDPSKFAAITTSTLPQQDGQPVVARVNGKPILWSDFITQAHATGYKLFQQFPGKENGVIAALSSPVLDTLILKQLYRQFAEEHHLVVQPSELNARLASVNSTNDPATSAAASAITPEEVKRLTLDILIQEKVDKFIQDAATSTPPTREEITSFTQVVHPTTSPMHLVRARHIVIRATPDMSQFALNDAKAKAEEVLAKIRGGMDFQLAARQYSQDRFSAYAGGNIGYFAPGTMYPEFEAAAQKLALGEVSPVIRTPVGYHIIQVTERHDDDLLLLLDKYRRSQAINQWKTRQNQTAEVESYLDKR